MRNEQNMLECGLRLLLLNNSKVGVGYDAAWNYGHKKQNFQQILKPQFKQKLKEAGVFVIGNTLEEEDYI